MRTLVSVFETLFIYYFCYKYFDFCYYLVFNNSG